MKLRLYLACVCSTFTHACEAWNMTDSVMRRINGFNSRCLHVITGESYRDTATKPVIDLLLQIRRRRMRYLGHVLRMHEDRLVRKTLMAYIDGGRHIPDGSLLMDCQNELLDATIACAMDRKKWNARVLNMKWTDLVVLFVALHPLGAVCNVIIIIIKFKYLSIQT